MKSAAYYGFIRKKNGKIHLLEPLKVGAINVSRVIGDVPED